MKRLALSLTIAVVVLSACAASPAPPPGRSAIQVSAEESPIAPPEVPSNIVHLPMSTPTPRVISTVVVPDTIETVPSSIIPTQTAQPIAPAVVTTPTPPRPTATVPIPTPTAAPTSQLMILPFNYQSRDDQDGWKLGTVNLAFVNTTDRLLPSQEIILTSTTARVETKEGKTYDAQISGPFGTTDDNNNYIYKMVVGRATKNDVPKNDLQALPLPPYLPIWRTAVEDSVSMGGSVRWSESNDLISSVRFRFAKVSTPTRLMIPVSPLPVSVDLPSPGIDSPQPNPVGLKARSLSDLSSDLAQLYPKAKIEFDQCTYRTPAIGGSGYFVLPYRLVNNNQFDQAAMKIDRAVWYANGAYLLSGTTEAGPLFVAGPGQTVKRDLVFKTQEYAYSKVPPAYLLLYYGKDNAKIYQLGCK